MVAYASVIKSDEQPEDFNQDVYVYNLVDGGEPLRLTAEAERVQGDGFPQDWRPAWSPDGTRIYFESNRSGNPDVWAIDPTGANPTRITFQPTGQTTPTLGYQDALLRAP
jgi:Tol biopolymer transport system component